MHRPRVIVALDYASAEEAEAFVARVTPEKCRIKVGLELYTAAGPQFVRRLTERGFKVFLDLKFHDIPNTVERACQQVAALGVDILTVHCSGGGAMLEAARRGIGTLVDRPRVVGVTLLTSLGANDLRDIGMEPHTEATAMRLATLAREAKLDGVVCAATEAQALRRCMGADFLLITPGIRPAGAAAGGQARVATPAEAISNGADLLVLRRPITQAPDPLAALGAIELETANFH